MIRNLPWKIMIMKRSNSNIDRTPQKSLGFFLQVNQVLSLKYHLHIFRPLQFVWLFYSVMAIQKVPRGVATQTHVWPLSLRKMAGKILIEVGFSILSNIFLFSSIFMLKRSKLIFCTHLCRNSAFILLKRKWLGF